MDYRNLIAEACDRNGISRYRLAQLLGFKQVSSIYLVEKGAAQLSAAKLMKLLELAGKRVATLLLCILAASATIPEANAMTATSADMQCGFHNNMHYRHYRKLAFMSGFARLFRRLLSLLPLPRAAG